MEDVVARALGRQGRATGRTGDEVGAPWRKLKARNGDPKAPRRRLDDGGGGCVAAFKYRLARGGIRVVVVALAGPIRIHRADALWVRATVVCSLVVRRGVLCAVNDGRQRHALQPNRGHEQ
jgi:hypothetical protein